MSLTIINFVIVISLTWGTNIMLNVLYVLKRYIPQVQKFDYPLDFRKELSDGERMFGESTTLLGFFIVILISIILYTTKLVTPILALSVPLLVYSGHLFGSFIKRRLSISDGKFVPLLDHGDYMITAGGALMLMGIASWQLITAALLFTYLFHPLACLLAFKLKLREHPY